MVTEDRFEYRPKFIGVLLATGLFSAFSYGMFLIASSNVKGLILFKILHFTPSEATFLYWALFMMFLSVTGISIIALVRSVMPPRYLILKKDEIEAPKGSTYHGITTVKYRDIQSISVNKVGKTLVLQVRYKGGKLNIPEKVFKDKDTFLEIGRQLQTLCNN